ncbi:MAG: short-chain dehydrogenase [Thiotrichales bacterium]|nr:short-chain dehydrogenase [Thiotrichales bacterium]
MSTVLITGANRGIGFELARQYAADGWRVHAASRSPETCSSVAGDVVTHELDVTRTDQISSVAAELTGESLDVLINNAGIYLDGTETLGGLDIDAWDRYVRVNTLAPLLVSRAFGPLLAGDGAKLVNISSRNASMALATDDGFGYGASKAALNAITRHLAIELAPHGVVVLAVTPGWVRTDMGGPEAALRVDESVAGIRELIASAGVRESGQFYAHDGEQVPW